MIGLVVGICGVIAVVAWITALLSAIQIVRMAPAGQRFKTYFALGWWQFGKIRTITGAGVEPFIKRYKLAFLAFFATVVVSIVVSMLIAIDQTNGPQPEQQASGHGRVDPRILPGAVRANGVRITAVLAA